MPTNATTMARAETTIQKLLVANRGEIACRVIRAAHELKIATVAVYADQDAGALHVREADERYPLDGTSPQASYLSIDKIIDAARRSGADAVHPGYGFLSESPDLARACADAGLVFIGPPPEVLRDAGDKTVARERAEAAGVPCLPTQHGDAQQLRAGLAAVGLPALLKAAAGGGGRGMRRVERAADLDALREESSREAERAFGDGRVYLERLVERARHVEFQVLADWRGTVVTLGDRECSIQRRHQKIIEESPSPALDDSLRTKMRDAATAVALAVGYRGAGTVQVEHPVTELVTGEDLVIWQLRLARGESLPERMQNLHPRGHAVECRICAETPPEFLPSSGRILEWFVPCGPGVRVDQGYATSDSVPSEFDSLLAKVIAWGQDRETAIRRAEMSLEGSAILGVDTNVDFLVDVLRHREFQSGAYSTSFLQDHLRDWKAADTSRAVRAIAEAARSRVRAGASRTREASRPGPWESLRGWDPTHDQSERERTNRDGIEIEWIDERHGNIVVDGGPVPFTAIVEKSTAWIRIDGRTHRVEQAHDASVSFARPDSNETEIRAPMPGVVTRLLVADGQEVADDEALVFVEAMKMEHELRATKAGRVAKVHVGEGDKVDAGSILVELES
jgi:3-methylcrotonyl-CoA carboxylase alpha subunit